MGIMDSLGLDQIEADPNALPDGKWPGVVYKSDYVFVSRKNEVSHVITYRVSHGERKGAERQEWFALGEGPIYDDAGNIIGIEKITMPDTRKSWYKKRHLDLGIPEGAVSNCKPSDLVGRTITFGTKKNGDFINVNFVELRNPEPGEISTNPAKTTDAFAPSAPSAPAGMTAPQQASNIPLV